MPRKLRLEYPGAIYHIMSRGDQRQDIFLNDVDSQNPGILSIQPGACGGNQQATQSVTRNT